MPPIDVGDDVGEGPPRRHDLRLAARRFTQGAGQAQDVQVASAAMDPSAIEPNATARIVVAFKMPDQQRGQRFTVGLREKNGSRHVQLDNLGL